MMRQPRHRPAPTPVRASASASGLAHVAVLAVALFGYPVIDIVWSPVAGTPQDVLAHGTADREGGPVEARALDIATTADTAATVGGIDPAHDVPTGSTGEVGYTVVGDTAEPQTRAGRPDTKPVPPVVRTTEPTRQGDSEGQPNGTTRHRATRQFVVMVTLRPDRPDRPDGSAAGRERIVDADGTDDGQDERAREPRPAAAAPYRAPGGGDRLAATDARPPAAADGVPLPAPELALPALPEQASGMRPTEPASGPARPNVAFSDPRTTVRATDPHVAPDGIDDAATGPLASVAPRAGGVPAPPFERPPAAQRESDGTDDDEKNRRLRAVVLAVTGSDDRLAQAVLAPPSSARPGGLPDDPARQQRIALLQAAAQAGYARAQFALARQYIIGEQPQATMREAIDLLRDAAERGDTDAQLLLGVIYAQGKIARRDLVEAQLYLTLAAAQGAPDVARVIEDIESDMTLEQIIDSRRVGRTYRKLLHPLKAPRVEGTRGDMLRDELLDAAAVGNTAKIARALARGADLGATDGAGRTAVINAAWRGRTDAIELLLSVGADIDARDAQGRTALAWAASNGHTAIVSRLIAAGADLDVADTEGTTALMRAAWNGHLTVVETLRAAGASAGRSEVATALRRVGT